jgi:hypothetical protein
MTSPNIIAEIFARDPREHSDADFKTLIEHLRDLRLRFVHEGGKPAAGPKSLTADQKKAVSLDLDIKL